MLHWHLCRRPDHCWSFAHLSYKFQLVAICDIITRCCEIVHRGPVNNDKVLITQKSQSYAVQALKGWTVLVLNGITHSKTAWSKEDISQTHGKKGLSFWLSVFVSLQVSSRAACAWSHTRPRATGRRSSGCPGSPSWSRSFWRWQPSVSFKNTHR